MNLPKINTNFFQFTKLFLSIYYYFKSGDGFRLACFDWSKKMTKENNWRDHIKISAFTNEITTWFNEKAYK